MEIVVITLGSYPYGGASTNRQLSYLKGLANNGVTVSLFSLQANVKHTDDRNCYHSKYQGIDIDYGCNPKRQLGNIVSKVCCRIYSHIKAIRYIVERHRETVSDFKLVLLLTNPFEIFPYLVLSKICGIPIFHERTEYPFLGKKSFLAKINLQIYLRIIIPRFNGIFVISNMLKKYFESFVTDKNRILHLPMTVDLDRFNIKKGSVVKYHNYIAYCGSMYSDKDGLLDLILAFNLFASKIQDVNLLLIGDSSDKIKIKHLNDLIFCSPYKERILLTGWVERDVIPDLLINAQALLLARPDNIQAQGGFPTKLGEYLATGNPVVITNVGEHSDYLVDGVSAFIANPNDSNSFASKMLQVYEDIEKSKEIGERGKQVAIECFNSNIQSVTLLNFLNRF